MAERFTGTTERKKRTQGVIGIITMATLALTSCRAVEISEAPDAPATEKVTCVMNGRDATGGIPADQDPNHLTAGEAVSVFPGVLELENSVVVRPIVEIAQQGVIAAYNLVYDTDAAGFRFTPVPPADLKAAAWIADTTLMQPGEIGDLASIDQCTVPGKERKRTQPIWHVVLQATAATSLDASPAGLKLETALAEPTTRDTLAIEEWPSYEAFGMQLANEHSQVYNKAAGPMATIKVPVA